MVPGFWELTDLMEWKYPKWIDHFSNNSVSSHKVFTNEVSKSLQVCCVNCILKQTAPFLTNFH